MNVPYIYRHDKEGHKKKVSVHRRIRVEEIISIVIVDSTCRQRKVEQEQEKSFL
jgi:hypothetical protein